MNISPSLRSPHLNFWTLGYRRFYSPLMRAPGGRSAASRMAASLDQPDSARRGGPPAPAAGPAANAAPGAGEGASPHVHGVQ